jgi:hypothetical protein
VAARGTIATPAPVETPAPVAADPIAPTVPDVATVKIRFDADTLAKIKTATAWRPKDGDTLTGNIVTVVKRTGEYGPYPCVILRLDGFDKFTAVHAFHGVLQNELKDMKAKPDDNITILYTGKRTANKLNADGSEKNYHGYSVVPTNGAELDVYDF